MASKTVLKLALDSLKERLERNDNAIEIYLGNGTTSKVTCRFNNPLTDKELENFIEQYDLVLPIDYRRFLLMHDGAKLFFDPYYGGEFELFNIETIIDILNNRDFPENWLIVGYHYGQDLVIDMDRVIEDRKDYLLYRDSCSPADEAHDIGMNFEIWLEHCIQSQRAAFWEWGKINVDSYYKTRGLKYK